LRSNNDNHGELLRRIFAKNGRVLDMQIGDPEEAEPARAESETDDSPEKVEGAMLARLVLQLGF
jgi:hypothetical protein